MYSGKFVAQESQLQSWQAGMHQRNLPSKLASELALVQVIEEAQKSNNSAEIMLMHSNSSLIPWPSNPSVCHLQC